MANGHRESEAEIPVPPALQVQLVLTASRLARGEFDALVDEGVFYRVTAGELRAAVDEERHWATIVEPPADAYKNLTMGRLHDGSGWWVDAPVWTAEEDGPSDLYLVAEFIKTASGVRLFVSDLHVL